MKSHVLAVVSFAATASSLIFAPPAESSLNRALQSAGLLNSSQINHFCVVTNDFNMSTNTFAQLFGGDPPAGALYRYDKERAGLLLPHAV